jgi:very-short-patch-repair endonuclease
MRNAPTSAERIAWEWLRGNLTGLHFRRQAVVAGYIVDFYCGLVRIADEVDGKAHNPDKDRERDRDLEGVGVETIRIPARRVYGEMGEVFDDIRDQILEILARDEWTRKRFLKHYGGAFTGVCRIRTWPSGSSTTRWPRSEGPIRHSPRGAVDEGGGPRRLAARRLALDKKMQVRFLLPDLIGGSARTRRALA